jgi:GxxExxY protein
MDKPLRNNNAELEPINKVTERIIACAIEVHPVLRCGLIESVYQSAMAIEFESAGLPFEREVKLPAV